MKLCTKCKQFRPVECFDKDTSKSDGYYSSCKQCKVDYNLKHAKHIAKRSKKYKQEHKEAIAEKYKEYCIRNKERIDLYRKNNKEKIYQRQKAYVINKYRTDINFKLKHNLRIRIYQLLKGKNKATKTLNFLGCSFEDFKNHLEAKFKPGMSWNNYCRGGWEIDHIKPCKSFNLSKKSEQYKCFHYTNLQPLWMTENRHKQGTYNV